uniref:hypothetical protein n=1 Tax=Ruegeria arenilitoris TaxID=1173585 RepID=UPI0015809DCE|nr:hypothetical protein [Ruegeria arenilitoris]
MDTKEQDRPAASGPAEPFVKLFECDTRGQILVELTLEDCAPGLRVRGETYRGAPVEVSFEGDTSETCAALVHEFETMTATRAEMLVELLRGRIDIAAELAQRPAPKTERIEVEIGFKIPEEDQAILDRVRAAAEDLGLVRDAAGADRAGDGAAAIAAERRRQVTEEGFGASHDDDYTGGELAAAAACYAAHRSDILPEFNAIGFVRYAWPWDQSWWKPQNPRSDLVRAGALIAAEIDRLDRAEALKGGDA